MVCEIPERRRAAFRDDRERGNSSNGSSASLGFFGNGLELIQGKAEDDGSNIGGGFGLAEEGERIRYAGREVLGHVVVEEIVRCAVEDAAELLHVAQVRPHHGAGGELLGGVVGEAVLLEEGVRLGYATELGEAIDVDEDHGGRWIG